ncbi:hypothetical protein [Halalkalicoccus jeotgali]|uniref:Uncharacterized protein n=1 Tax=Halalkalicoccus jeotgali (strain DSM 18796 / CECT 7217 / JCM 14584 / KCTC 4019 / B3) TaxID=795797 RepID=D8J4R2_HALJB|nr:hypothetical protein [Halalkalicoccus jeotgali]ADJ15529.1 hypothetical protein HacjB3_10730 [Halalkalicoccus jeotgali B3]ELY36062.1 hypothetical protein C497_11937 [Halalkalicoccus jeotgali B3]
MGPALAVEADLELVVEGHPISVTGSGSHLTVASPTVRGAVAVLRGLGTAGDLFGSVGSRFVAADLSADVDVDGSTVARIGPHVEPNALSELLGLAPARVWPGALVRALLRDLRA